MTKRLYYHDSYTLNFTARVQERIELDGLPALALDATYFYPTGGGQPHDLGYLNQVLVQDVQVHEDVIWHILEKPLLRDEVQGEVLWQRRFDHMQQHSGQHLLSRAFEEICGAATIGFHLSENSVTIDLNAPDLPQSDLDAAENLANQIIMENRPVRAWFPSSEELADLALRKLSEKVTGAVRVVDMGGFDLCACGGTHVAHTGEIGLLKILKVERNKKNTRIEFSCGGRALADYRQKNHILLELASSLTTGFGQVGEVVAKLREDNKSLQRDLKSAQTRLLQYEAEDIWRAAHSEKAKFVLISHIWENRAPAELSTMVQHLSKQAKTIALMGIAGEKAHLVFGASEDSGVDVLPWLKAALETVGAKGGGGRPSLAQGGGFSASWVQMESILDYVKKQLLNRFDNKH